MPAIGTKRASSSSSSIVSARWPSRSTRRIASPAESAARAGTTTEAMRPGCAFFIIARRRRCTFCPSAPSARGTACLSAWFLVTTSSSRRSRASRLVVRDGCPRRGPLLVSAARVRAGVRRGCAGGSAHDSGYRAAARVACRGADAHPPRADGRAGRSPGAARASRTPPPRRSGACRRSRASTGRPRSSRSPAARALQPRGPRVGAVEPAASSRRRSCG